MKNSEEHRANSKNADATDSVAGVQQDDANAVQPETIQNHSVKQRKPPTMRCVTTKSNDVLAVQTDATANSDDTQNSADSRKRARVDCDAESSSDTEKEQARAVKRVVKKRRNRQAIEGTLNELIEWSHDAHTTLSQFEQDHKTLKESREDREGETTKWKKDVTNLLEAIVLYNARLEEDRGRYDSHEAQADADRTIVKDLTSQIQQHEDNTATQLQHRPTLKNVADIKIEERKARVEAIEQSVARLKATVTGDLTLANDRVDTIDQTLNAFRKQSDARISKVEKEINRCDHRTTETAAVLSALQSQIRQTTSSSDSQGLIAIERKAREKALSELPGKWTVSASTLCDARIANLESKFEAVVIPRALDPLRAEVHTLGAGCKQGLEELKALAAEVQRKSHVNHDRTVKETQSKLDASKAAFAKETARLDLVVHDLQKDLCIEREKLAEIDKLVSQADVSRAEDKQEMLDAMAAQKGDFSRKLGAMEIAHAAALETNIQSLRAKLHAQTENADSRAKEVEALRHRVAKVEADTTRESETRKGAVIGIRKDLKTLTERVGILSDAVAEAKGRNTSESHSESHTTLEGTTGHFRIERHAENTMTAARKVVQVDTVRTLSTVRMDSAYSMINALDLHEIYERLRKLESFSTEKPQHPGATLANIHSHLEHLTSRIDVLQKSVDECSDIDLLKRQHADHIADCKAKVQERNEASMARVELLGKQLQHRIDSHLDLQSHIRSGHHRTDSPQLLATYEAMRASNITTMKPTTPIFQRYDGYIDYDTSIQVDSAHSVLEEKASASSKTSSLRTTTIDEYRDRHQHCASESEIQSKRTKPLPSDGDPELPEMIADPDIQEISQAEWLSAVTHHPGPSNVHENLDSSVYCTKDDARSKKRKCSPEPSRPSGAAWLAKREEKSRMFTNCVDGILEDFEGDDIGLGWILKAWEVPVDKKAVRKRTRKMAIETPCPEYLKGVVTFRQGGASLER
ncbi:hypothetical protein E8E12_009987 [Didymella heteroderae]|uniref:Uncharacterized protein n=1 Tax=Didymella heteroderae TaxID=1769908 RepID=A0A9P4X2A3_9PLEO|nr:hypothetical protein E8E12_009987 [Didymella heteroderae]